MRFAPTVLAAVMLTGAPAARADDIADLQLARNAYDAGEYGLAAQRFEQLVEREPPPSVAIRLEALQFLGASRLFLGNGDRGRAAFEQLLILDPSWELSAVLFPTPILDEFTSVKTQMAERLAALETAARQERAERLADYERRRAALAESLEPRYLARVDENRSFYLSFVPLGVGQFQNGQDTKGWIFFGTEVALAAANIWTFWAWNWYAAEWHENPESQRGRDAAAFADGYKIASWAVLGTLVGVVVAGIVDAIVFYEDPGTTWMLVPAADVPPGHRLEQHGPDEFLTPPDLGSPSAFSLGLSLRF